MNDFTPLSYKFVVSGLATNARANLCVFNGLNSNADWAGRGNPIETQDACIPITNRSYWEDRYVLTEVIFSTTGDYIGEKLTVNDVTVCVSRNKNITKTVLVGLNSTIKEDITNSDWTIRMSVGIVASENGKLVDEYPVQGLRAFKTFLNYHKRIYVTSAFFELFNIFGIVIERYAITQTTESNRQVIDIWASSDNTPDTLICTEY